MVLLKYNTEDLHEVRFTFNGKNFVTENHVIEVNDDIAEYLLTNPLWVSEGQVKKKSKKKGLEDK